MAQIQDLDTRNIQDMSEDELLDFIKVIRGRRLNPSAELRQATVKKAKAKQSKITALTKPENAVKDMSLRQLEELEKFLISQGVMKDE